MAPPAVDQYALEVTDLEAAILDGGEPHVSLAFSRGTVATLAALDQAARIAAGVATPVSAGAS
jgi:hypothetical protein